MNLDQDGSGGVDIGELSVGLKILGLELSAAQTKAFHRECDKDGDGSVSLNEFMSSIAAARKAQSEKEKQAKKAAAPPPPAADDEGHEDGTAHSVAFTLALESLEVSDFSEAKRAELRHDLASNLRVKDRWVGVTRPRNPTQCKEKPGVRPSLTAPVPDHRSQVAISAVRAGSVVVDAVVSGIDDEAKARSIHHTIKEKASAGMLLSKKVGGVGGGGRGGEGGDGADTCPPVTPSPTRRYERRRRNYTDAACAPRCGRVPPLQSETPAPGISPRHLSHRCFRTLAVRLVHGQVCQGGGPGRTQGA